jgi:lipopolysaccharide export system protein LptA
VLNGSRLVIDLNSGRTALDGHTSTGPGGTTSGGGRVTGTFTVARQPSAP